MKSLLVSRNHPAAAAIARIAAVLLLAAAVTPAAFAAEPRELAPAESSASSSGSLSEVGKIKGLLQKDSRKGSLARGSGIGTLEAAACVTADIPCNTTVADQLTADDCRLPFDQSFYDAWTVSVAAGQTIQITMRSTAFDTYLILFDPSGLEVENNDDFPGEGNNSRIIYTADVTGTYTIYANSLESGETGTYSLQVLCTQPPGPCTAGPTTLCLTNSRFRVTATFATPAGQSGNGMAVTETTDTGMFWFFNASNIEVIIKVLDGCPVNSRYWVFAGGLTNVAVTITVTDTSNGTTRTYTNPLGTAFQPVQDTSAFATCP